MIDQLFPQYLRDLRIGSQNPISIKCVASPPSGAFREIKLTCF